MGKLGGVKRGEAGEGMSDIYPLNSRGRVLPRGEGYLLNDRGVYPLHFRGGCLPTNF